MKSLLLILLLCISPSALPPQAQADDSATSQPGKSLRILFVGNSYTNGSWQAIDTVFKAADADVVIEKMTAGGARLSGWAGKKELLDRIRDGNWDYVVLQEQSQLPSLPDEYVQSFFDAATSLDKSIRESGATTAFFMTWGRRDGDKQNRELNPDFETMQQRLSASYRTIAQKREAVLAPVGEVYLQIKKTDQDLFGKLYRPDGSHPALGAYAAAYCLYRAIYGEMPPEDLGRKKQHTGKQPRAIANAKTLQTIRSAVEAVFKK